MSSLRVWINSGSSQVYSIGKELKTHCRWATKFGLFITGRGFWRGQR